VAPNYKGFDTIDIFYGTSTTPYFSINPTGTLYTSYFSVTDLVTNKLSGYNSVAVPTAFSEISTLWFNNAVSLFSTVKIGLLRFKFDKDYSNAAIFSVTLKTADGSAEGCVTG
jgi:hypothetical protein